MKNRSNWILGLIFTIAIIAVFRFDKFGFAISDGRAKAEVHGEQQKTHDGSNNPLTSSATMAPPARATMQPTTINVNKTQGSQSPIVNNSNGTSSINYDTN